MLSQFDTVAFQSEAQPQATRKIKKKSYIKANLWSPNLYLTCNIINKVATFTVSTTKTPDSETVDILGIVYLYLDGGIDVTSLPINFQDEAYLVVSLFAKEQNATPYLKT